MTVRGNVPQYYLVPIQHPANVEDRKRQIKTRLARLENGQKKLKADQRWPTRKSLSLHLYQQLTAVPEIVVHPPTPCPQQRDVETDDNAAEAVWSYSHSHSRSTAVRPAPALLAELLAPSASPRAAFPIAVTQQQQQQRGARADPEPAGTSSTSSSSSSSFIYFPFLPLELRLQIWELALQRPRFIEAQFASQFYAPTFVGPCTRGSPLLAVCRESRECALCEDFAFLTPTQRDFGKKWSRTPFVPKPVVAEKPLPFIPERDTIFFRSLDRPQGGLQSLACSVAGFENIQHLALPLPSNGLSLRNEWRMCLGLFRDLKTLTFLVGSKEQSWVEDGEIELRDVEEWFADGRDRMVKVDKWLLDVSEVGPFLSGVNFEERMRGSWDDEWEGINVRVAAWKKRQWN